jgi:preprotein translocase subunit YajC
MGGGAAGGNPITQIGPLVLIVVVFYFFMIRPQMKKQKETKKYIESLKVNDKILTIGGIYGTINKMNDDGTIIIAVEDGSKMKIAKSAISQDATSTLNQTV